MGILNELRYERKLRKGGEYLYDNKLDRVLQLPDACELLNKNDKLISEFVEDLKKGWHRKILIEKWEKKQK